MDYPRIEFKWRKRIRLSKVIEVSFPTKNDAPVFDKRDLGNDGNSSSVYSNFRRMFQNMKQRDFDDSAKSNNRDTETERGGKRKDENDSNELTEEANDAPIQMISFFKQNRGYSPTIGKGLN